MRTSNPDRLPVIVEKHSQSYSTTPDLKETKFLVPHDLNIAHFKLQIRKRMPGFDSNSLLYLFFGGNTLNLSELMKVAYEKYKDEDGFLYVTYSTNAGEKPTPSTGVRRLTIPQSNKLAVTLSFGFCKN